MPVYTLTPMPDESTIHATKLFHSNGAIIIQNPNAIPNIDTDTLLILLLGPTIITSPNAGTQLATSLLNYPPQLKEKITVSFTGYDTNVKELYEIPEIQNFCQEFILVSDAWNMLINEAPFLLKGQAPPLPGILTLISFGWADTVSTPLTQKNHSQKYSRNINFKTCLEIAADIQKKNSKH